MRPEDRNARQVQQAFADSATLDELEKHIAFLRSPGAPGDAHPMISFNDEDARTSHGRRTSRHGRTTCKR
jgi:hypothetical protein